MVIEASLTNRNHFRVLRKLLHLRVMMFFDLAGIVWMHTHAGVDPLVSLGYRNPAAHVVRPASIADSQDGADTGIARPLQNVAADPNPNLTVHLVRRPRGDWIGVRAWARWQPERGIGMGGGALLDTEGEIGSVSMAVALTPFPAPAAMRASA